MGTILKQNLASKNFHLNLINDANIAENVILDFEDESALLPTDMKEFESNKTFGKLSDYIGKKFVIMAYETGGFIGRPIESFEYMKIVPATTNSLFYNSLIVLLCKLE